LYPCAPHKVISPLNLSPLSHLWYFCICTSGLISAVETIFRKINNLAEISSMLLKGTQAPDFALFATPDQKIMLSELRGKKVILAFYPADWSPVCGDQMTLYNEMLKYFRKHNAELMGISVDGKWCHTAFSAGRNLHFPLLADFEPKGAVAKLYHAYDEALGECKRALYVIDEAGVVQWSYLSPVGINPGADGIMDALEELDLKNAATA
jgi:peroxiredoxin